MQLDDAAHILGSADFFSICNLEQRRMLAFAGERCVLRSEEILFRVGDVTDGAYVLISGVLSSKSSSAGDDQNIEINQPGTVIGELALIAKHPRRATIVALTDAELLLVPRTAFSKLMQQFPDIAQRAAAKIRQDVGAYIDTIDQTKDNITKKR